MKINRVWSTYHEGSGVALNNKRNCKITRQRDNKRQLVASLIRELFGQTTFSFRDCRLSSWELGNPQRRSRVVPTLPNSQRNRRDAVDLRFAAERPHPTLFDFLISRQKAAGSSLILFKFFHPSVLFPGGLILSIVVNFSRSIEQTLEIGTNNSVSRRLFVTFDVVRETCTSF